MRKKQLLDLIEQKLLEDNGSEHEMISLKALKSLVVEYTYPNRLFKKGIITYRTRDQFTLPDDVGELALLFDEYIS